MTKTLESQAMQSDHGFKHSLSDCISAGREESGCLSLLPSLVVDICY